MIKVWIDGREIETEVGRTILDVARREGVYIPTLCYHEALLPIGSCRLCIVEIEGIERPQTACTTYVVDGMRVRTWSEKLLEMRREFLNLILMDHPLDCPQCDKAGSCRLQDLVYEHGIQRVPYRLSTQKERLETFATPLIRKWGKRCVGCLRCYHACREISGRRVLEIGGNGFESKIVVSDPKDCISCGECLNVCPVGALTEALSPMKTRPWMSTEVETICPHCGFGCALRLEVQDGFVTKAKGSLCVRGRFGYDFVNGEERIRGPYLRIYDEKRPLSLEEAGEYVISRLKTIALKGPIGFLVSPRVTNEEVYLLSELGRAFPKSLFSSSAYLYMSTLIRAFEESGLPLRYSYEEIRDLDLIMIFGCELLTDNHMLATKVREAVRQRGSRVVVVDPAPVPLARIADLWMRIEPGTDHMLVARMVKEVLDGGLYEKEVEGLEYFEGLRKGLDGLEREILKLCGVEEKAFQKAMGLLKEAKGVGILFGTPIFFEERSLRWIINLSLLKGARLLPVIPQANAIGLGRILRDMVSPQELLSQDVRALVIYEEEPFGFMEEGSLKKALSEKEFIVLFSPLPTDISSHAHLCLPSGTFAEKSGTFLEGSGSLRALRRVRVGPVDTIELLKALLSSLKGRTISDEEMSSRLRELFAEREMPKRFLPADYDVSRKEGDLKARIKDLFKNPYLQFSEGVGLVSDDRVFISGEDASALGISDGDDVIVENERGRIRKKASVATGMRKGFVLVHVFREKDALKLFEDVRKEVAVSIRKA